MGKHGQKPDRIENEERTINSAAKLLGGGWIPFHICHLCYKCMPLLRSTSPVAPGMVCNAWKGTGWPLLRGGGLLRYWALLKRLWSDDVNFCNPEFAASNP
eukprot:1138164-Pelagomonas_calceolata.AAC.1